MMLNYVLAPGLTNIDRAIAKIREERPMAIINTVCKALDLDFGKVTSRSRKRELVDARCLAMHFLRQETGLTCHNIALLFGGRDHATVIHMTKQFDLLMRTDKYFRLKYDAVIDCKKMK